MTLIFNDRVLETATSPGTGTITLLGAVTGYQSFSDGIGAGNTCYYTIESVDENGIPNGDWEVGLGSVGAGTLSRDTVSQSSNADALVNFTGAVQVFCTIPSEYTQSLYDNDAGYLTTVESDNYSNSALGTQAIINGYVVASVAANALTIALKTYAGNDPSASDPVKIVFRNSAVTNGQGVVRTVTGALSITVPSGATLGHIDGQKEYAFVYAIDNSGTVELAIGTHPYWDEGNVSDNDTLALGTGSDSRAKIYSTSARNNVPIRQIARIASTQTTAGTWAAAVEVWNSSRLRYKPFGVIRVETGNGHGSTNTKIRRFTTSVILGKFGDPTTNITYADSAALGGTFTINEHGIYTISYGDNSTIAGTRVGISVNSTQLTTDIESITGSDRLGVTVAARNVPFNISITDEFIPGDVIRAHGNGLADGAGVDTYFQISQIASFKG